MGIFEKFKIGLNKSALSISGGIKNLVLKKKIDEETLNNLEEFLIQNDVGVEVANEIKNVISEKKIDPNQDILIQVSKILSDYIEKLMFPLEKKIFNEEETSTKVFLIAGVNGVGKTTTIGKLGKILKNNKKKIIFAAADTFRAAAIEQLNNWSKKNWCGDH